MSSAQPSEQRSPSSMDVNAPSGASLPQPRSGPPPPPRQVRPRESAVAQVAGVLKLASALFGLAAAALFIHPLFKGDLDKKEEPRLITLKPSDASSPPPAAPAPREEPAAPRPTQPSAPTTDPVAEAAPAAVPAGVQENRTAFKGALLMIDSQPSGAIVRVNGVNQGDAPVTVGLDCSPGTTLNITFSLKGYENLVHHTPCPKDALVKVMAQLHPGSGSSKSPGKTPGKRRASP